MGFLSSPAPAAPPPPPPVPPAANPPTYANSNVQASAGARRQAAAVGAGFEGSLFTGPQGAAAGPQAKPALSGVPIAGLPGVAQAALPGLKDKLGT